MFKKNFCERVRLSYTFTSNLSGINVFIMSNRWMVLLAVFVSLMLFSSAAAQRIKAVRDPDSANILKVKKAGDDLPAGDLANAVEKYPTGKTTLTISPDKRYEASVFCVPSRSSEIKDCVRRVFVLDLQTDEDYEIVGEELGIEAGRLINDLRWINNYTLSYERWTGPHYGHRYIVDIKAMKQTGAFILSDQ